MNTLRHKPFSVIIADAEVHHQNMVKMTLRTMPVQIQANSVYSGLQLMDCLLKRESYSETRMPHPDLILLDLDVPIMDGFEVLKQLQFIEELSKVPVYVMSKKRLEHDRQKALALGARGFLLKPLSGSELYNVLDEITGLHLAA
jgi:CheY-like chemotaxis protein